MSTLRRGTKFKPRGATSRDANFLPVHIGQGFEAGLSNLLDEVCPSYGFKGQYLSSEVFSKYLNDKIVSPEERQRAAIKKWLHVELENSKTNVRLFALEADFGWVSYERFVATTQRIISDILGPLDYPSCLFNGGHTNGASTRIRRSPVAAIEKYTGQAHVSSSAIKHWLAFASGSRLAEQDLTLEEDNVLFTVPKKSDIDRVACKEPEINMFLQRSLGSEIRRKLLRTGINLNDQTINQRLAREGVSKGLATVDLSSASDCVTRSLVTLLLPFEWWSILDDLRCKSTLIDGSVHHTEMFSSMGNGFTFELESLLFYAITRSVCYLSGIPGRISVYGDDIIVPNKAVPRLSRVLHWFGFRTNLKKTHHTGAFRESCGKHYHNGVDVTPFYVRGPIRDKITMINILNKLMEWEARGVGFIIDPHVLAFHRKWSKLIPDSLWGGTDPDDPTSLVTGHRSRKRLMAVDRKVGCEEVARLTHWLTVRECVDSPLSISTSRVVRYKITDRPQYANDTTWDPYYMDHTVSGDTR